MRSLLLLPHLQLLIEDQVLGIRVLSFWLKFSRLKIEPIYHTLVEISSPSFIQNEAETLLFILHAHKESPGNFSSASSLCKKQKTKERLSTITYHTDSRATKTKSSKLLQNSYSTQVFVVFTQSNALNISFQLSGTPGRHQ